MMGQFDIRAGEISDRATKTPQFDVRSVGS